jgi:hypothetical protein
MNITLDLPDDAFAKADAKAKQESRSLGSVFVDLIRAMKSAPQTPNTPGLTHQNSKGTWQSFGHFFGQD